MRKKIGKPKNEVILYRDKSGPAVEVRMDKETAWLSLNQIADLFGVDKSGVSRHLRNIYEAGELSERATVAKIATVQMEKNRSIKREIEYYNLDAIISVGYRVNSEKATQFRVWATRILRGYLVKGYAFHEKRIMENTTEFERAVRLVRSVMDRKALSEICGRRLAGRISIRVSRRKRRIFSTSSSRIIRFLTGTSASAPSCSSFSFRGMGCCSGKTGSGK